MFVDVDATLPSIVEGLLERSARGLMIDGEWRDAASGKTFAVHDPSTGREIAQVPEAGKREVDAAVAAGRAALDGPWSQLRPHERQQLMLRLADLIEENGEEIAALDALNLGQPLDVARAVEVESAADHVRYLAGWATKIEGSTLDLSPRAPEGTNFHAYTRREPVGLVAAIVPWNFPHLMAIWKIAPALATGCTVVLKPAEQTPLSAIRLGELIQEAGFPPGVVNVLTGHGKPTGAALASHPGVDKVAFTGSTEVGKQIGAAALENMTRFSLELGGKSPVLVLEDTDPDFIAPGMMMGIFFNSGQQCVAGSRLYAPASRYDEIVERIAFLADAIRIGSPFDPDVQMGPLVSHEQQERVLGYIESGSEEGAEVVVGGRAPDASGWFIEPTVLAKADQRMRAAREEIFGPVLAVMPYRDLDDLLAKANDSRYGLAASIWSQNISRVLDLIPRLKAGTVWVNTHGVVDPNLPFGGFKHSGVGREHGRAAVEGYTELKSVCIAH